MILDPIIQLIRILSPESSVLMPAILSAWFL